MEGWGTTDMAELEGAAGTVCVVATGAPGVAMLLDGVNVEASTNEGKVGDIWLVGAGGGSG